MPSGWYKQSEQDLIRKDICAGICLFPRIEITSVAKIVQALLIFERQTPVLAFWVNTVKE
jgi:hypothetical protein